MSDFRQKTEKFYFWDEMWNEKNKDEKNTTENKLENPPLEQ